PATSTFPAARRARRRCSTASCSCRTRSSAETARPGSSSRGSTRLRARTWASSSSAARATPPCETAFSRYERIDMAKALVELLKRQFPSAVLESHAQCGDETVVIDPAHWHEVALFLKTDSRAAMDMM